LYASRHVLRSGQRGTSTIFRHGSFTFLSVVGRPFTV
jgi:hypothetical protein